MSFEDNPLLKAEVEKQKRKTIKILAQAIQKGFDEGFIEGYKAAHEETGEWTEISVHDVYEDVMEWQSARCSKCKRYHTTPFMYSYYSYPFCPRCGARMEAKNEKD